MPQEDFDAVTSMVEPMLAGHGFARDRSLRDSGRFVYRKGDIWIRISFSGSKDFRDADLPASINVMLGLGSIDDQLGPPPVALEELVIQQDPEHYAGNAPYQIAKRNDSLTRRSFTEVLREVLEDLEKYAGKFLQGDPSPIMNYKAQGLRSTHPGTDLSQFGAMLDKQRRKFEP